MTNFKHILIAVIILIGINLLGVAILKEWELLTNCKADNGSYIFVIALFTTFGIGTASFYLGEKIK